MHVLPENAHIFWLQMTDLETILGFGKEKYRQDFIGS
jgi:hypothetical protein